MKILFAALVVMVGAVVIALFAREDPGYVLVQFHGWTVEVSLILAAAAAAVAFLVLYYLVRLLVTTYQLPRRVAAWRQARKERRSHVELTRGFVDLMEGRWQRAERRLTRYIGDGEHAALSYLGAARAAQEQGNDQRRDRYLRLACQRRPDAEFGLALAQAEMQIAHAQYAEAAGTLKRLRGMEPKNKLVLEQLMRLYSQTDDWERLLDLLPALRKQQVVDHEQAEQISIRAFIGLLGNPGVHSEEDLNAIWVRMPNELKEREELLRIYVRRLLDCGANDRALSVLNYALSRRWSAPLAYIYGLIPGDDPALQLRRAEAWLQGHDNDAVLLLTLGRLCKRNGLWSRAKDYLEACVQTGEMPEAFNELAVTLEAMGEHDSALRYYRRGMAAMEADVHRIAWKGMETPRLLNPG